MQSIARSPIARQMIRHYALLTVADRDLEGIATLVPGGYAFQAEGETQRRLVSYRDTHLVLLGRIDLADEQRAIDQDAGLAAVAAGRPY